jgi:hypothetical protein
LSIEEIDAAENGLPHSLKWPRAASSVDTFLWNRRRFLELRADRVRSTMRHISVMIAVALGLGVSPSIAQNGPTKDVVVVAQDLSRVENPSEIERWWTSVFNTQEGKAILDGVALYFGYPGGGTAAIEGINAITGPKKDAGNEHWGTIQAPKDYTVCIAKVHNPSLNCNGTFTGVLRTADHRDSGGIDGLHWYMVVPQPGLGGGKCWANGAVEVTFVRASKKAQFGDKCHPVNTNTPAEFHYGK